LAQAFLNNAYQGSVSSMTPGVTVNRNYRDDQIVVSTRAAVVNWTPDNSGTGTIDFLPTGRTVEYYGSNGDFTILNRIVPTDASRAISINGSINSTVLLTPGRPAQTGGNIWFYSPGGMLVGGTASFNVGGLLLSANDIRLDATTGLIDPNSVRFTAPTAGSQSLVSITSGATINANQYVALIAPRIQQGGIVRADGQIAYIAAQNGTLNIPVGGGLFSISIDTDGGTTGGGTTLEHSGTTARLVNGTGSTDPHAIYMVTVAKNTAVTMLLGGSIDDAANAAASVNDTIVLTAGRDIFDGRVVEGVASNGPAANITIQNASIGSNLTADASGDATLLATGANATLSLAGSGDITADGTALTQATAGGTVNATGSLTMRSARYGLTAGTAEMEADAKSSIIVGGDATVIANGDGIYRSFAGTGGGTGGTAKFVANGGVITVSGGATAIADGGGSGTSGAVGTGHGGTASIAISNGGAMLVEGSAYVRAGADSSFDANEVGGTASVSIDNGLLQIGQGGSGFETLTVDSVATGGYGDIGGNATGGTSTLTIANGGRLTTPGGVILDASGNGSGAGGFGHGGIATLTVNGAGTDLTPDFKTPNVSISANGVGAGINCFYSGCTGAAGGGGIGGTASFVMGSGNAQVDALQISAIGIGGQGETGITAPGGTDYDGGDGGSGIGGNTALTVSGGSLRSYSLMMMSDGDGGLGGTSDDAQNVNQTSGRGGTGGGGTGGQIHIAVSGGTADFTAGDDGQPGAITLSANGTGGDGGASIYQRGGNGGAGQGGTIDIRTTAAGAIFQTTSLGATTTTAGGQGGSHFSGTPATADVGGAATGGGITIAAVAGTLNGGDATLDSSATSGLGGSDGGSSGTIDYGQGGAALGGSVALSSSGGALRFGNLTVAANAGTASASGGSTDIGGGSTGGILSLTATAGSIVVASDAGIFLTAIGEGGYGTIQGGQGTGGSITIQTSGSGAIQSGGTVTMYGYANGGSSILATGTGGAGQGGTTQILVDGGSVSVNGYAAMQAIGDGGSGKIGGTGTGGTALIRVTGGGRLSPTNGLDIAAQGYGGRTASSFNAAPDAIGGNGLGGHATLLIHGGTLTVDPTNSVDLQINASGYGGSGRNGGTGTGGTASFTLTGSTIDLTGLTALVSAAGQGGGSDGAGNGALGIGGIGTGGTATVTLNAGAGPTIPVGLKVGALTVDATGSGGNNDCEGVCPNVAGGAGLGGSASVTLNAGTLTADTLAITADAFGGTGGYGAYNNLTNQVVDGSIGGSGTGGNATLTIAGGTLAVGDTSVSADGEGGLGSDGRSIDGDGGNQDDSGNGGAGGSGIGGTAHLIVTAGAIQRTGDASLTVSALGSGGGGGASDFRSGGGGGNGMGGSAIVTLSGGSIDQADLVVITDSSGGQAGVSASGIAPARGGNGTAGMSLIDASGGLLKADTGNIAARGFGGAGSVMRSATGSTTYGAFGDGRGGTSSVTASGGTLQFGDLRLSSNAFADASATGTDESGSVGGAAFGGHTILHAIGSGQIMASGILNLYAIGTGGGGSTRGGDGHGGTVDLLLQDGGTLGAGTLSILATGQGGTGAAGGSGFGGSFTATANNATLAFASGQTIYASGIGNDGGNGTGGSILLSVLNNGTLNGLGALTLDAHGAGTAATGGSAGLRADGGTATIGGLFTLDASATGITTATGGTTSITLVDSGGIGSRTVSLDGGLAATSDATASAGAAAGGSSSIDVGAGLLALTGAAKLSATGTASSGNGTGVGGTVTVTTAGNGAIDPADLTLLAIGAGSGSGAGTGGIITLTAGGGDMTFGALTADASGKGASGAGGRITLSGIGAALTAGTTSLIANSTGAGGDVSLVTNDASGRHGRIVLGATTIAANGSAGGHVAIDAAGGTATSAISLASLSVAVRGAGGATPAFALAASGTRIAVAGDATITTDGSQSYAGSAGGGIDVTGGLTANAGSTITVSDGAALNAASIALTGPSIVADGTFRARQIGFKSAAISIGGNAHVGYAGVTQTVSFTNTGTSASFVGGSGGSGYALTAAGLGRVEAQDIDVTLPALDSSADVTVGDLTLNGAGAPASGFVNLGGTLHIATPGTILVGGNLLLADAGSGNGIDLEAGTTLTALSPSGSIAITDTNGAAAGTLTLGADRIYVASQNAINDLATAADVTAKEARLATNDGAVKDVGYLVAGKMNFSVGRGLYIQNSGAGGSALTTRRGFTVGAGGLSIQTTGISEIVINGRQIGGTGVATLGDALIPLVALAGGNGSAATFDQLSTINGCRIVLGSCPITVPPIGSQLPTDALKTLGGVRDVVDLVVTDDPSATATAAVNGALKPFVLPVIELSGFSPYSFAPSIDEPVTGAGNEELWSSGGSNQ
ncbi:MAG: putative outer rane autotransporter, partial [Sphingomonas bacterium]|nr:putative outer rane autotransporter [Sphingomonas bacterium]